MTAISKYAVWLGNLYSLMDLSRRLLLNLDKV